MDVHRVTRAQAAPWEGAEGGVGLAGAYVVSRRQHGPLLERFELQHMPLLGPDRREGIQ